MLFVFSLLAVLAVAAFLLQQRQPRENVRDLESHLPIWKIEQDVILSKQGDVTFAYQVDLPEIFSLSDQDYVALHEIWLKAFKVLPTQTIIHKQDWFTREKYQANVQRNPDSFLGVSSERFFNERPYLKHQCYLFLTKRPVNHRIATSAVNNLLRKRIIPEEHKTDTLLLQLSEAAGQFERILKDSGLLSVRRLSGEELAGTADKPGVIEQYCFLLNDTDAPVLSDIDFKPEFKIGSNYCQLFSIADVEHMPSLCGPRINYDRYSTDRSKFSVGFATPVCQLLDCNHIYNQYILIGDAQKTIKKLESKRLRLQSMAAYSRQNAISREAVNDFLNEAIGQQRMPVQAHYNLLCWTDTASEVKNVRNMASSALAQMEAKPKLESTGAAQLFWAGIPGNAGDLPSNEVFDTFLEQATCFFNSESSSRDSISPFGIRLVDRLNGKPVHVDISDEPVQRQIATNRNKIVCGGSGSGKSMFMQGMLRAYYEQGAHIVVVDVGHSYEGLCNLVKGYYFTFTESNPISFNPFYIGDGDTLDTEKKESLKTLLVSLWKQDNEAFRRSEYVALSNALHLYYEKLAGDKSIFPCFNTFYEYLSGEYVQILATEQVKEKDFDVTNFLYVLRPYYKDGEYAYLLNATEKLDIFHQRFCVFELDNIKDHATLFSVTALVVAELFISKMRRLKGVRKVIVLEEAWKAISKSGMAEFMRYLYKTVRKHFGEAIVVTQEASDIINSPIVKEAIINNADCRILLDMRKFQNKFDQIQEVFGLTDKARMMTLSLNKANDPRRRYREVFIDIAGVLMRVYGFEPSPQEYYAYTTEEREKVLVKQYADKFGGDIRKGIIALLEDQKEKSKLN
ncbi:conjugation system TraG family ATPase [Chitinophaga terrae (ex Kim and Jung 2007)]|uniref:TraG family conjugative transposon ATPase n=1 Tax=Chitinophaga terrae (ex Kim and Jung 2007) TaxID=408074 RepID=UPI002784CB97|nr:TraG family conjugative transposon ATPase [Chitinophaga terrae (ex Kim and Jung 2007)]MDQ0107468.1 conjugation system TraG family ATPase [Chitinophaga terrae (ex Kim and Jung 2007)]